jgi:hypothetical protein
MDRAIGVEERLLQDIIHTRGRHEAPAVPPQGPAVALDDRLEGRLAAALGKLDKSLVGLRAEDSAAGEAD